jgi:thioesterase domain-containing protein
MLVPVQTTGTKPPLFFVHGMRGVMPLGSSFARGLGPDQPVYAIHANGVDGQQPVIDNMPEMIRTYIRQIHEVRPTGTVRIAGMCEGGLAAIEIARELQKESRQVGPVILADPPHFPPGFKKINHTVDPRHPLVAARLYQQVRGQLLDHASYPYNDMPFDPRDPEQLHLATLAGIGTMVALVKHMPAPFTGAVEVILSAERADGFLHPQMPWRQLLLGPRIVHVLPWNHTQLFRLGREQVGRLLKFMLEEEPPALEMLAERPTQRTVA